MCFFGKCYGHLHNCKGICAHDERSVVKRVCAKSTESFWVRGTMDDLTDKQCHLSLTEPVDSNSMSRVTSCMFSASCSSFGLLLCTVSVMYCHVLVFLLLNSKLSSDLFLSLFFFPPLTLQMEAVDKLVYFFIHS